MQTRRDIAQNRPREIFSMIDGMPRRNLLGLGDPDVCRIEERWHMFMGGFNTSFKNNLYCATLAPGEPLSLGARWTMLEDPDHPGRARSLVPQPAKGEWDHYGLHEPCHAAGPSGVRRVYYTGRASAKTTGTEGRFAIGFLEWRDGNWHRHGSPIMHGHGDAPSALGPKVIYANGQWHMWFRMVPHEPAKGIAPRSEIFHSASDDGISGWSPPRSFAPASELLCHAFVADRGESYAMLSGRVPNLHGEDTYPAQQLLLSHAESPAPTADGWSQPVSVLDAASGADWYGNGFFGPSIARDHGGDFVFFTGVHRNRNWFARAAANLLRGKLPPVPAPYHFSVGAIAL